MVLRMQSWPNPSIPTVPGAPVPLKLHDTADAQVKPVRPGPEATMYVCGITPYDSTHLGHAATYLTFDLVQRVLIDNGHTVHYVQNITDVDDPLFERAERDGVDWRELGTSQIDLFRSDMANLSVIPPRDYVGAIESVDEVVEMVGRLLESGAAYQLSDDEYPDVYFDRTATPHFGYESNYDEATMAELFAERGGDPERVGKRDPLDALLWRAARDGEPAWDAPFGRGRPGWHIECSAIAVNRLGVGFDIQGGGSDLAFPHHEFSAAHAEAACAADGSCGGPGAGVDGGAHGDNASGDTGVDASGGTGVDASGAHPRMAGHYVHAGMIGLDGTKMSKSLGNLVFVSKLVEAGTDPSAIRLGVFAGHYRSDRDWSDDVLADATRRLDRWRHAARVASDAVGDDGGVGGGVGGGDRAGQDPGAASTAEDHADRADRVIAALREALSNDLDTTSALAAVDAWADDVLAGVDATEPATADEAGSPATSGAATASDAGSPVDASTATGATSTAAAFSGEGLRVAEAVDALLGVKL